MNDEPLPATWLRHIRTDAVRDELLQIELLIADEVASRRPRCQNSGRCCGFEAYGHRLYLTGLEVAWTWSRVPVRPDTAAVARAMAGGTCPFVEHGCSIHPMRPPGCRIYYCDSERHGWQQALAEACHERVRAVHDSFGIPYRYGEWRGFLEDFAMYESPS